MARRTATITLVSLLVCAATAGSLAAQARGGGRVGAGLRSAQVVAKRPAFVGRTPVPVVPRPMGPRLTIMGPTSRLVVPQLFPGFYPPFLWGVDTAPAYAEPGYVSPSVSQNEAPLLSEMQPLYPAPPPTAGSVESLVLENRGGQWVRVSNYGQSPAHELPTQPGSAPATATKLPPASLVFRDGHSEEVERYMVQGNFIFASTNYWSTGSWTRKIPVAELDVPATLKLNEERGVNFKLPSGPNEIIIRP
jgi:hypothetical protein